MAVILLDQNKTEQLRNAINKDPEFELAAKYMSQDVGFAVDDAEYVVEVREGIVTKIKPNLGFESWNFRIQGTEETWEQFLQPVPPPLYNHLFAGLLGGSLTLKGDLVAAFAFFWATSRMMDVMRELQNK